MAPVDPTTTNRLRVHYTGPFGEHTMLFHGLLETSQAALRSAVAAVVSDMIGAQWDGTTWDTAEYAEAGSNLFFPDAVWDAITADNANNPTASSAPSAFLQFGGRGSEDGRRVKWYLFEVVTQGYNTMRIASSVTTTISNITNQLGTEVNSIGNIAGQPVNIYQYANVGQNDYLTRKARS